MMEPTSHSSQVLHVLRDYIYIKVYSLLINFIFLRDVSAIDSNERQTDACDRWSEFQETKRDSTSLDRGSDAGFTLPGIWKNHRTSEAMASRTR